MKFHSSKVEFVRSFLGRNDVLTKSFLLFLTFTLGTDFGNSSRPKRKNTQEIGKILLLHTSTYALHFVGKKISCESCAA